MTEGERNKENAEYDELTFINDPFTLRHSTSGGIVGVELIFKTQLEQTPEQSDPKGLIQRSLAKCIAFQRF
jgi:hypothetical protein